MHARSLAPILSVLIALSVAACGSGAGNATEPAGGSISIGQAWVRAGQSAGATAAYMAITNGTPTDETLVAVSTDVAASASLHQTTTDSSGMTGMHPVGGVKIPPGATVTLEPGGYHVMLEGLTGDLTPGQIVPLTLTFQGAGPIKVSAEVRAN